MHVAAVVVDAGVVVTVVEVVDLVRVGGYVIHGVAVILHGRERGFPAGGCLQSHRRGV